MQRNFGLGDVASLLTAPGLGRIKKGLKKAWEKHGPIINPYTKTYDLGFDTYKISSSLGKKKKVTRVKRSKETQGARGK